MILLISGPSASGKTTIAHLISERYGYHHIDGDQVIKDLDLKSKAWNSIHHNLIEKSLSKHKEGDGTIWYS